MTDVVGQIRHQAFSQDAHLGVVPPSLALWLFVLSLDASPLRSKATIDRHVGGDA